MALSGASGSVEPVHPWWLKYSSWLSYTGLCVKSGLEGSESTVVLDKGVGEILRDGGDFGAICDSSCSAVDVIARALSTSFRDRLKVPKLCIAKSSFRISGFFLGTVGFTLVFGALGSFKMNGSHSLRSKDGLLNSPKGSGGGKAEIPLEMPSS
jgi:hypothetical protein